MYENSLIPAGTVVKGVNVSRTGKPRIWDAVTTGIRYISEQNELMLKVSEPYKTREGKKYRLVNLSTFTGYIGETCIINGEVVR